MKPGAKPKPKTGAKAGEDRPATAKPKTKAVWKTEKPAGDTARKPKTNRPEGKPAAKTYDRAADPSKRFTPPNKIGEQGGKPAAKGKPGGEPARPSGGNAVPRRGKNSFGPK